ncbi:MAG TPA: hypothetical protein VNW95_08745 [Mucilaginibacter sp.]|jgi:hypothetical protein|nr:hypothetical protein [Mucilaginibacter sp.]
MRAAKLFLVLRCMLAVCGIVITASCSSHTDNNIAPQPTLAEILVQSGKWVTTGATLVASDGTRVTLDKNDPFIASLLLADVTFYADGTAIDLSNPNGLTIDGLTWTLDKTHLLVHLNHNNTDKVDAIITSYSSSKIVMEVTDFYLYNGITYVKLIQTLTH